MNPEVYVSLIRICFFFQRLPVFFGGVDTDGNGPVVFLYAGEQYRPQTGIVAPNALTVMNDLEIRRTAYSPSGTVMLKTNNYGTMEIPSNIANYLNELKDVWSNLARDCGLVASYHLVFFINAALELEMLVLGNEGVEVVFQWAREYHKII
ncbi:hypothetical protein LIER_39746 [Lithospermum erythrorhizon]|uniref:Uncharacterized protein n=1 Tax=Lithospermum erythrorhizon TaxID=34254 RepID=A0AAV3QM99_LITER